QTRPGDGSCKAPAPACCQRKMGRSGSLARMAAWRGCRTAFGAGGVPKGSQGATTRCFGGRPRRWPPKRFWGLRGGRCPEGLTVRYDPVFRRDTSALPTNTVLAFVAEDDGTLWFGTALGLTRLQQGHFTRVPFERTLTA